MRHKLIDVQFRPNAEDVDAEGNTLNEDGTVTDIATGKRVVKRGDKWVPAD